MCDLIPTFPTFHSLTLWVMILQPLVTLEEKKKYLKQALDENWKLFFGHDPEIAFVTIKKIDKRYIS